MAAQSAGRIPATAPQPGALFAGKYRVEHVLGVGGMGYVIAATHVHLHERVAIKILLPDFVDEEETVQRFLREGRAAVRIQSPHVARVKDVGALPDKTPYIVMEYMDGCDLDALLEQRGQLSYSLAVDYVLEACEAIAEAHAMKTVHRDLKPSNLFLARMPNGTSIIKVLDFGISKMHGVDAGPVAMTATHTVMGSPSYMSPEQLKASRMVDHRADIWSLGVILHELISGFVPFRAESLAELSVQILSEEPPWLAVAVPEVPSELAGIVATCLRKDVDERFVDLADLANAIAPFGSPEARRSAERITQTLGMPLVRATPRAAPSLRNASADQHASTQLALVVGPAPHSRAVTPSLKARRRSAAFAFVIASVTLATLGLGAGGIGLWYRRSAHATAAMGSSPSSVTSATAAASIATDPMSEPMPPTTWSTDPTPAPSASAPQAPAAAAIASASGGRHPPTRPAVSAGAAPPASGAAPVPVPKAATPSSIATSSKD